MFFNIWTSYFFLVIPEHAVPLAACLIRSLSEVSSFIIGIAQNSGKDSSLILSFAFIHRFTPLHLLYTTFISFLLAGLTCVGSARRVFLPGSWHIVAYHSNAGCGKGTAFFLPRRGGATLVPGVAVVTTQRRDNYGGGEHLTLPHDSISRHIFLD